MEQIIYLVVLFIISMNIAAFVLYGIDKKRARNHKHRIQESTLLWMAVYSGALGSLLGMLVFRHKTKHLKFKIIVPLMLVVWIGLIATSVYFILSMGL